MAKIEKKKNRSSKLMFNAFENFVVAVLGGGTL
jgi:hypothetical protein